MTKTMLLCLLAAGVFAGTPIVLSAQDTIPLAARLSRLEERVDSLEQILQRISPTPDSRQPATRIGSSERSSPLQIELLTKRLTKRSYDDIISLSFRFTSHLDKEIRAFTGIVVFQDLFDRDIMRVNLTVEKRIPPGGTATWEGGVDYNQFISEHQRLASINQDDLKTTFELEMVMYTDGTREEFGQD